MKLGVFIIVFFLSVTAYSQSSVTSSSSSSSFDFNFGVGTSFIGAGDFVTLMFENEVGLNLNPYFATSLSLGYGKSNYGAFDAVSFLQTNLNLFISPFKNVKRNNFRIGLGIAHYKSDYYYRSSVWFINEEVVDEEYIFKMENTFGTSIVLENTYLITSKMMLGVKLFSILHGGPTNSGVVLRVGMKL